MEVLKKWDEVRNNEFIQMLHLNDIASKRVKEFISSGNLLPWSSISRLIYNIDDLRLNIVVPKTNIITTCFKVSMHETSSIYAYLYSTYDKSGINHQYVCCSPTYRSQDGEYRHRIITWDQFLRCRTKYEAILSDVVDNITTKMARGDLDFQIDICYPINRVGINERNFEESINVFRMPVYTFALCWICDFYAIHNGIVENHINPAYQYIIYDEDDIPIYENIIQSIGMIEYERMIARLSQLYKDLDSIDFTIINPQCGQKLIPLTYHETSHIGDINFGVWRELYVSKLCSSMLLNAISPNFSYCIGWFFVQNSHQGIYDNHAMHEKYKNSDLARDVTSQLREVDKYNYYDRDRKKGPVNAKFLHLSNGIQDSIYYADSAIRLTDLSICITSEYTGRTIRDAPSIAASSTHGLYKFINPLFTKYDIFQKHIFEFIYGFYCMNSKFKVIHGDLHINNVTINILYHVYMERDVPYITNPRTAHIIENDVYVFAYNGLHSTIIDFSRAILGDYEQISHDFGEASANRFFEEQRNTAMRALFHYFPKFMQKNKEKIEALMISNFKLIFKIMTLIDPYSLCSNIGGMIQLDEEFVKKKIVLASGIDKLLAKIIQLSENLILEYLQRAIDGSLKSDADIEWPNLSIIKQVFSEAKMTTQNIASFKHDNIVDVYNSNNPIVNYAENGKMGKLFSLEEKEKIYAKHKADISDIQRHKEVLSRDETNNINLIASKYAENPDKEFKEAWIFY